MQKSSFSGIACLRKEKEAVRRDLVSSFFEFSCRSIVKPPTLPLLIQLKAVFNGLTLDLTLTHTNIVTRKLSQTAAAAAAVTCSRE